MRKTLVALLATLVMTVGTAHAVPTLFEMHTWSQGGYDAGDVNLAGFDTTTGLGTIRMTFTSSGSGGLYVDHEVNESQNTMFNEFGGTSGAAPGGVSWEIDEPGFGINYTGDIYTNFGAKTLDNTIFDGTFNGPEDVAMAMIRSFTLTAGQTAVLSFTLTDTEQAGFFLRQFDPNSQESIYFSSSLDIRGGGDNPVPEPSTILLLGAGLAGLGLYGRKRSKQH
jgi:hypothetical protein